MDMENSVKRRRATEWFTVDLAKAIEVVNYVIDRRRKERKTNLSNLPFLINFDNYKITEVETSDSTVTDPPYLNKKGNLEEKIIEVYNDSDVKKDKLQPLNLCSLSTPSRPKEL